MMSQNNKKKEKENVINTNKLIEVKQRVLKLWIVRHIDYGSRP